MLVLSDLIVKFTAIGVLSKQFRIFSHLLIINGHMKRSENFFFPFRPENEYSFKKLLVKSFAIILLTAALAFFPPTHESS